MSEANQYNDQARADAYARLGITNGYYLAYRDLPGLFSKYQVLRQAAEAGLIEEPEIGLRPRVALVGGELIEPRRLALVLRHAAEAVLIEGPVAG